MSISFELSIPWLALPLQCIHVRLRVREYTHLCVSVRGIRMYVCPYVRYVYVCARMCIRLRVTYMCTYPWIWTENYPEIRICPSACTSGGEWRTRHFSKKKLNYCILAPAWQYICCNTKIASFFYVCEIIYVIHADSHVMSFIYYISLGKCTLILLVKNDLATHLGQY